MPSEQPFRAHSGFEVAQVAPVRGFEVAWDAVASEGLQSRQFERAVDPKWLEWLPGVK